LHSYEVPEVMCFRIDAGNPAYLQWIHDEATGLPPEHTPE